jgi:hypothetical protein
VNGEMTPFIKVDGKWDDGSPRYKWTETRPIRLHPYMKDKKHYVTVTLDGEKNGGPPIQQGDAHEPDVQQTETFSHDEPNGDTVIRRRWADLQESYEACVKIAAKAWQQNALDVGGDFLVAAAATLFIEANKRNLPPPPKRDAA